MRHFSRLAFATPSSIATSPRIAAAGRTRSISVLAQPPPNPSQDFEPIEPEDLLPGEQLSMSLTDSAVKQIERAQQAKQDPQLALRLLVESGGCHGYQYKMAVTSQRDQDDYLFAPENTTAKLLVDSASLPLVKGSTIDYATELIGSSFRVMNNPQSKDAGCGCGVSWELKDL
ncbi:Isa2p [Sporobolomyces koalae]|uniref:Isa2p n=1 Tax=Sporobolomyces koalae TaxID=500713 RepID=UPI0031792CA3